MGDNKHIKSFRLFESTETSYISFDDIKDIFIDIIHKDYQINFYDVAEQKNGKYFFEFKKSPSEDRLGYFSNGSAYGYSNLSKIKEEIDVFDILDDCKHRLNSMGYIIGFEFEFNISTSVGLAIVCHLKHNSIEEKEEENDPDEDDWGGFGEWGDEDIGIETEDEDIEDDEDEDIEDDDDLWSL